MRERVLVVNLHKPKIFFAQPSESPLRGRSNDRNRANRAESIRVVDDASRPKRDRTTSSHVIGRRISITADNAMCAPHPKMRSKTLGKRPQCIRQPSMNAKSATEGDRRRSFSVQRRSIAVRDPVFSSEGRSRLADWPCRPTLSSPDRRTTSSPSGSPWPVRPCRGCWRSARRLSSRSRQGR